MKKESYTPESLPGRMQDYIMNECQVEDNTRIIAAVSGGMDSVVLCDILSGLDYPWAIAHCNFNLRGKESDGDAGFVRELAEKYNVDLYYKEFDTLEVAHKKGISVEMAARDLRYNWFSSLLDSEHYSFIATGHHVDDQVETFFLNLLRSSGISGFRGMLPRNGNIIRPLLFAYRSEIENYAEHVELKYRHDSSNDNTEFRRNKIRHELIPLLEEMNPAIKQVMNRNMKHLRETELVYNEQVSLNMKKLIIKEGDLIKIDIPFLLTLHPVQPYLFEILSPLGFNEQSIKDAISCLYGPSGKQFMSATHKLIKDRDQMIITSYNPHDPSNEWDYLVNETDQELKEPIPLSISHFERPKDFLFPDDMNIACLDKDKLQFPMKLRRWEKGDFFFPLGMKNRKKLSDFFSDNKLSLIDKDNIWLLTSQGEIVWIVGHRIDDRYRITNTTNNIAMISLLNK